MGPFSGSNLTREFLECSRKEKHVPATVGPTDIPMPAPSSVIVQDSAKMLLPNISIHALNNILFTTPVKSPVTGKLKKVKNGLNNVILYH